MTQYPDGTKDKHSLIRYCNRLIKITVEAQYINNNNNKLILKKKKKKKKNVITITNNITDNANSLDVMYYCTMYAINNKTWCVCVCVLVMGPWPWGIREQQRYCIVCHVSCTEDEGTRRGGDEA